MLPGNSRQLGMQPVTFPLTHERTTHMTKPKRSKNTDMFAANVDKARQAAHLVCVYLHAALMSADKNQSTQKVTEALEEARKLALKMSLI